MVRLLAMILTAYDSRRNPAAGLLWRTVSHAFDSVAKLTEPSPGADASGATADNYTKNYGNMHERYETGPVYRAIDASGKVTYLRANRY